MLIDAELVVESVAGTRRLYRINQAGMRAVRDYFDRLWETRRLEEVEFGYENGRNLPRAFA